MIEKLRLFQFRNFNDQTIKFDPGFNIFVGNNGQGKSNILEAVHLLLTGESFRPALSEHMIQHGKAKAALQSFLTVEEVPHEITLKFEAGKKKLELDKKLSNSAKIQNLFVPILFSPESLNAIKGSADERRKLIDLAVGRMQKNGATSLSQYRKILRTRNKILKDAKENIQSKRVSLQLLEAIDEQFLKAATDLVLQRLQVIDKLKVDMATMAKNLKLEATDFEIKYEISGQESIHLNPKDIHSSMLKRLAELYDAQLSSGTTLVGPHKHSISFLFSGKDSRFFCSQGQQRGLILSFKLAQIAFLKRQIGGRCLLLLDDVLSELDDQRRQAFVSLMNEMESQVMITTTDFDYSNLIARNGRVHQIRSGEIL